MMKHFTLRNILLLVCLFAFSIGAQAKKYAYEIRIYTIIYNGDTLETSGDVVRTGILKKHTKRLPIATLNDGRSLHLEMWLTVEGVMLDKFNVFQHKYYALDGEEWLLMTVSPRLKFKGRHYDKGHYYYRDPQTGETLEVMYKLTVDPYKKKKKKKKT
ncbi:MAG: hypothetical protein ACI9JN_000471 [Bacteroidia bacterium]|jgi:hypothetical protein